MARKPVGGWVMTTAADTASRRRATVTTALRQASAVGMNVARIWGFSEGDYIPLQISPARSRSFQFWDVCLSYSYNMDDEIAKFIRRVNPPRVVIDNEVCKNVTVIKVDSANKHGILLEVVQVLTDLNLTKAYISSDGGWFALTGFGLFNRGFPVVGNCVEIGVPMLILFVIFSQYLKNFQFRQFPVVERFALIIALIIVWAYAHLLTASGAYKHRPHQTQVNCRTDMSNLISSAPWIKIPYPLQWGAPSFDAGPAFAMMAAVFVSLIELMSL